MANKKNTYGNMFCVDRNESREVIENRIKKTMESMVTDTILTKMLEDEGFAKLSKGYYYLGTAIQLTAEDMAIAINNVGVLRDRIAWLYDVRASCVERAIRHSTEEIPEDKRTAQKWVINRLAAKYLVTLKQAKGVKKK